MRAALYGVRETTDSVFQKGRNEGRQRKCMARV
jgi:hypothetical protein